MTTVADVQRVSEALRNAVRTTSSFIYGTSTLLGQEVSLDYLLAVREYVEERIKKEADSWGPQTESDKAKAVKDYTEDLRNRTILAQTLQTKRLLSSRGLPTLSDLVG